MTPDVAVLSWGVILAYFFSSMLVLLALLRLSSDAACGGGSRYGMAGIALAIGTTLYTYNAASLPEILIALAAGAAIGLVIAYRVAMAALPQLVAAFHSLVGLATVAVGVVANMDPGAAGISYDITFRDCIGAVGAALGPCGLAVRIPPVSAVGIALAMAAGAISFAGSVVVFLTINGVMTRRSALPPGCYAIIIGLVVAVLSMIGVVATGQPPALWLSAIVALSVLIGVLLSLSIDSANRPVVLSMLNSCSGWGAVAMGFTMQNWAMISVGAIIGSSGAVLSYGLCKAKKRGV